VTSVSDPLVSLIEGVISRGDADTAVLIEEAWRRGCRLDAWQDAIRKDIWQDVLQAHPAQTSRILGGWGEGEGLPWDRVDSGVQTAYLAREYSHSTNSVFTSPCIEKCTHPCGICESKQRIVKNNIQDQVKKQIISPEETPGTRRILFSFEKTGSAVFHSQLSVQELFSMAFLRANIPALYSAGFNPLPRLEITAPLSLGVASRAEIAALDTEVFFEAAIFQDSMNQSLPQGFRIVRAENFYIPQGAKKHSLSSLLWGFEYESPGRDPQRVSREEEKKFRQSLVDESGGPEDGRAVSLYRLTRNAVLAAYPGTSEGLSYFDVYRSLYPEQTS
jgi:hypothetical protein